MATRLERENAEAVKQNTQDTLELKSKIADMEKKAQGRREDIIKQDKNRVKILQEEAKEREAEKNALKEISDGYSEVGDRAKAIGDSIDGFVKSIPGGEFLAKAFGVDDLGKKMQDEVIGRIQESFMETQNLKSGFKMAFGPVGIGLAVITAVVGGIIAARKAARNLGQELNISTMEAQKMLPALKLQEMKFKAMGLDSSKITTTLSAMTDEFMMDLQPLTNIPDAVSQAGHAAHVTAGYVPYWIGVSNLTNSPLNIPSVLTPQSEINDYAEMLGVSYFDGNNTDGPNGESVQIPIVSIRLLYRSPYLTKGFCYGFCSLRI